MDPWLKKELQKTRRKIPAEKKKTLVLNMQLLEECLADTINYEKAEELLRRGAEPLGYVEDDGWPNNLYSVVLNYLYDRQYTGEDFYKITELFLRYRMDIAEPAIPYDREWVLHSISTFLGVKNDCMLRTMRLLLDHGLKAEDAAMGWVCQIEDLLNTFWSFRDPTLQAEFPDYVRMLMLTASYPHVLKTDDCLQEDIWYEYNHNRCPVEIFNEWDWYDIDVDTSKCEGVPQLHRSLINLREKATGKIVWTFGIHLLPADIQPDY